MTYSALRLCAGRSAFEASPRPRLSLDLAVVAERLREASVPVTDARVMLIIGLERETTLGQDGRVLIKSSDPDLARRVFGRLREILDLPELAPSPEPARRLPERLIPP